MVFLCSIPRVPLYKRCLSFAVFWDGKHTVRREVRGEGCWKVGRKIGTNRVELNSLLGCLEQILKLSVPARSVFRFCWKTVGKNYTASNAKGYVGTMLPAFCFLHICKVLLKVISKIRISMRDERMGMTFLNVPGKKLVYQGPCKQEGWGGLIT